MALKTIITAYEVIKYGPFHPDYPTDYVCDHIPRIEQSLFRECYLGVTFYNSLLNDLADYSDVEDYDAAKTYNQDDFICYEGCIWLSLINTNTTHPSEDDGTAWKLADKFTTASNNDLWESNLRYWLAYEVSLTSVDYGTYHMGAHGATKQKADKTGQETVSRGELDQLKRKMRHDADKHIENMLAWMQEHAAGNSESPYASISTVADNDCADSTCTPFSQRKARRFYFKR